MSEVKNFDVIIAGGGPAGLTAGIYCARAGLSAVVLESMVSGGQMAITPDIENYPGFESVSGFELAQKMEAQAIKAGAKVEYTSIESLELEGNEKTVHAGGKSYCAPAVIVALGGEHRKLGIPGESEYAGRGVSYCATCDGMFFRGKNTAVVGGGNTALEDAIYLSKICSKVYLVHRRDEFRGEPVLAEQAAKCENVEFVLSCLPESIQGGQTVEGLRVKSVKDGSERLLDVSGVFVAVGIVPKSELIKGQVELDGGGYAAAGEDCRTNLPGVFVAGDIRVKPLCQIVTAVADGAVAAKAAREYISEHRYNK